MSLLAPTFAGGVGAQTPTFASRAQLVVLSATAVDSRGRPVTDLRREEFRVIEEGRPQPIVHFAEGPAVPAHVLLLADASGSMNGRLKTTSARMAAIQVLAALGENDEVALASFDRDYRGMVAWTRDKGKVEQALAGLETFGSTALHDALDRGSRDLARHSDGRRAIVVITDGVDTASVETPEAVISRSRALDVPIYAMTVVSPLDDPRSGAYLGPGQRSATDAGRALLQRYADLSGGAAFVISDFVGLKKAADLVALEIKHQYRLAYDLPLSEDLASGPPEFRRVQVRTTRKGIHVRTRRGYVPPI